MTLLSPRHIEALEALAGWRPKGDRAARMSDVDLLTRLVTGNIFEFEDRTNGRVLLINVAPDILLQICWHTQPSVETGYAMWTFPRPFRDSRQAVQIAHLDSGGLTVRDLVQRKPTATSVEWAVLRRDGTQAAVECDLLAIGLGARQT